MKYLIINADDFGLNSGINAGIRDCFLKRGITNASVIINEEGSGEAANIIKEFGIPSGLHLNLFSGTSTNHLELFGENGRMRHILAQREELHNMRAHLTKKEIVLAKQEFEHQLGVFKKLVGSSPNHLSYHHGIHFVPGLFAAYVEFAKRHGLPFRAGTQYGKKIPFHKHPDQWIDVSLGRLTITHFMEILDQLKDGVNEISVHPGYKRTTMPDPQDRERENELRVLISPEIKEEVKQRGIILADYSILNKR